MGRSLTLQVLLLSLCMLAAAACTDPSAPCTDEQACGPRGVDLLFVMDNSSAMEPFHQTLLRSVGESRGALAGLAGSELACSSLSAKPTVIWIPRPRSPGPADPRAPDRSACRQSVVETTKQLVGQLRYGEHQNQQ